MTAVAGAAVAGSVQCNTMQGGTAAQWPICQPSSQQLTNQVIKTLNRQHKLVK